MKKILIDVFGSDHPEQLLEGCARCTLVVSDITLVLPGEEALLRAELEKYPCNWDALEFMPASEIITNHDDPIDAVMHKRDSTLVKGMQRLKRDPELAGMLTAGSTGAALAGGLALQQNHLYMATVDSRGVQAGADGTKLLVRGNYSVQ